MWWAEEAQTRVREGASFVELAEGEAQEWV